MRVFYRAMHSLINARSDAPTLSEQRDSGCHDQSGSGCTYLSQVCIRLPVNGALQHNAVNTTNSAFNVDQGDLKIDFKASQRDNISYRFTRAYQNNPSFNSQVLLSNGYSSTPIYNMVGDWTRTIGTNLVNDARVGWSHITLNSGNGWASGVGQFGNTLGIGNGNPANLDGLLALNFSNTAVSNLGAAEQTQSFDDHVWQFSDGLSWSHGRHNFKFGGQLFNQTIKTFYAGNNGQLGLMDFDGRFTSPAIGGSGGDGGADFVLGLNYQYGRGVSTGKTWQQFSNVIGVYARRHVARHGPLNLESRSAVRCAHPLDGNQRPAGELQHRYRQYRPRRPERGQSRSLQRLLWRQGLPAPHRVRVDSGGVGRAHGDPRRLHNFVVSGRYRHEPSFDTQSTFHSGRNQCHL